jgi:hypothetical protein
MVGKKKLRISFATPSTRSHGASSKMIIFEVPAFLFQVHLFAASLPVFFFSSFSNDDIKFNLDMIVPFMSYR